MYSSETKLDYTVYLYCGISWNNQGLVPIAHIIMTDHRGVDEALSMVQEIWETVGISAL